MFQQSALMLTAGLILLFSFTPDYDETYSSDPLLTILSIVLLIFIPGILMYIFGWMSVKRYSDSYYWKIAKLQNLRIYTFIFSALALSGFAFEIFYLKLPLFVDKTFGFIKFSNVRSLISIIPLIASITLTRLIAFELEKSLRDTSWTWRKYASINLKFALIPLLPFVLYLLIADFVDHSSLPVRLYFISHSYIYLLIMLTIIMFMYALSPYFIRSIWPTKQIPDSLLQDRIDALAKREGIKYRKALVWNTSGSNISNAAMTGIMPLFRYIFLTDTLLNDFNLDEIETIVAHEFGHIKYRHILAYLVFSLGYLIFYMFLYVKFIPLLENLDIGDTFISMISAVVTIFAFLTYFVFIFRFLSRRFELQSDLYAVDSTGKPEAFKNALIKLSEVNYMPSRIPRIFEIFRTHPSIHRRIDFIDKALKGNASIKKYRQSFLRPVQGIIIVLFIPFLLLISSGNKLYSPGELEYEIGRQYAIEGMVDEAIAKFKDAEQAAPKNDRIYFALGILYFQKGLKEESVKSLEKSLEINPKNKSARKKLEEIREKMKKNI